MKTRKPPFRARLHQEEGIGAVQWVAHEPEPAWPGAIGTSSGHVSDLMNGRRCPSPGIRPGLIDALGVDIMPEDFPPRRKGHKEATCLSWKWMAYGLGVNPHQLWRWRNGGGMLAVARLAVLVREVSMAWWAYLQPLLPRSSVLA